MNICTMQCKPLFSVKCSLIYFSTSLTEDELHTGWETVKMDLSQESSAAAVDIQVDSSQLPLVTSSEGEQVLRLFWLDAYEDVYKHPGKLAQSRRLLCAQFIPGYIQDWLRFLSL